MSVISKMWCVLLRKQRRKINISTRPSLYKRSNNWYKYSICNCIYAMNKSKSHFITQLPFGFFTTMTTTKPFFAMTSVYFDFPFIYYSKFMNGNTSFWDNKVHWLIVNANNMQKPNMTYWRNNMIWMKDNKHNWNCLRCK